MTPAPRHVEAATTRLGSLRRSLQTYRDRYGLTKEMGNVNIVEGSMDVRRRRLERLRAEAAELDVEIAAVEGELAGLERWLEFCINDAIERVKERFSENWSPEPVLGFRLWAVRKGGLYGVRTRWRHRTLSAICAAVSGDAEIPHTDGRCGRLGCGVYASKEWDPLRHGFGIDKIGDFAAAVVALTGKVVEHDKGYRAATATVVALGVVRGARLLLTAEADEIEAIFADPGAIAGKGGVRPTSPIMAIESYLKEQAGRAIQWT